MAKHDYTAKWGGQKKQAFNDELVNSPCNNEATGGLEGLATGQHVRTVYDQQFNEPIFEGNIPQPTDEGPKRSNSQPVRPTGAHGDGEKT